MKVVSQYIATKFNAGPKAKLDIEKILKQEFQANIKTLKIKNDVNSKLRLFKVRLKKVLFLLKNLSKSDILLIQAPFSKHPKMKLRAEKKIVLIHDIDGLREKDEEKLLSELAFFKTCDIIISHNPKMTQILKENHIENPIYEIELFDYLCEKKIKEIETKVKDKTPNICYAGNLEKSPFIQQLEEEKMNFKINLYGKGRKQNTNSKLCYKGAFPPDDLPNCLEGDFGLVWDGNFDESDEEEGFKNYTRYNNPHKFSCYLAANMPVIVWEKAAIAEMVKKYNIGYTICNLYEINQIDFSSYEEKKKNVVELGKKVRSGYFTKKVMQEILQNTKGK